MIYHLIRARDAGTRSARRPRGRRLRAAMAVALAASPFGTVTVPAAGAHPSKPKQSFALRIGIDNGRTDVRPGDRLTYITKISNTGTAKSPDLLLTQTLVPGLKLISSTPKGTASGGQVSWKKTLPAGRTEQFGVTVEVGRLSEQLQRLAAVVCASTRTGKRPIVCASHSDAVRTAAPGGARGRLIGTVLSRGLWFAIAGAGALVVASLVLLARRRRQPSGR
jgi:uncharacterized repeat protein (TIGR01451 family)